MFLGEEYVTHSVMTAADRTEELDRQLRLVERGESSSVFCPWCAVLNTPDSDDCCPAFTAARDERGVAQLQKVIDQQADVLKGRSTCISCPYCERHNYAGDPKKHPWDWKRPLISPFCCDLFERAVIAIAERMAMQAGIDKLKRIEDGIDKGNRN